MVNFLFKSIDGSFDCYQSCPFTCSARAVGFPLRVSLEGPVGFIFEKLI